MGAKPPTTHIARAGHRRSPQSMSTKGRGHIDQVIVATSPKARSSMTAKATKPPERKGVSRWSDRLKEVDDRETKRLLGDGRRQSPEAPIPPRRFSRITSRRYSNLVKAASADRANRLSLNVRFARSRATIHVDGRRGPYRPTIAMLLIRRWSKTGPRRPQPRAYRQAPREISSSRNKQRSRQRRNSHDIEPERRFQIAIRGGSWDRGRAAMVDLCRADAPRLRPTGRAGPTPDRLHRSGNSEYGNAF